MCYLIAAFWKCSDTKLMVAAKASTHMALPVFPGSYLRLHRYTWFSSYLLYIYGKVKSTHLLKLIWKNSLISECTRCITREDKTGELPSSNTAGGIAAGIGCTRQSLVTNTCSPGMWVPRLNHCLKSTVKHHGPDSPLYSAKVKQHQNKVPLLMAKTDFMIIGLFFICMRMYT